MRTYIKNLNRDCNVSCQPYEWYANEGECIPKCGNGSRFISYFCKDTSTQQKVSDEFCHEIKKPLDYTESCNIFCYNWKEGEWTTVSSF